MITLVSFIIVIGILIFVHEFGHFIVAKKTGVTVEKFSLGFGPKLIGFERGGTQYMLSAVPLGGYVKLKGENPDEGLTSDPGEFGSRSVGVRAAIVAAGPFMNFVLSFLIMPFVFLIGIQVPTYLNEKPVVQWVAHNSPSGKAGLQKGDEILAVDNERVDSWKMFNALTQINPEKSVRIQFIRDGRTGEITIPPSQTAESGGLGVFHYIPPRVAAVVPDSPASRAGLQSEDVVEAIDGSPVSHWIELSDAIRNFTDNELSLVIRRNEQRLVFSLQPEMVVDEITKNSPAEESRMQVGDRIASINGKDPSRYKDALLRGMFPADEKKLDLNIIRDGSRTDMSIPLPASGDSGLRVTGKIGIVPAENLTFKRYGPLSAIREGFKQAWEMTTLTVWALGKLLSLDVSFKTLGGPIMIAKMTGTAAKSGLASLIIFTAFLSMNLSILNLLPVPILDGGHLLFFLIEFIIRRPLGTKSMELAQKVGLVLLIVLLITVTYNDILRALPQKYIDFLPWK